MVLSCTDTLDVQKQPIDLQIVIFLLWLSFEYVTFIWALISLQVANVEQLFCRHSVHFASTKISGFLPPSWFKTSLKGHSPICWLAVSGIWEFSTRVKLLGQILVLRRWLIVLTSLCVTWNCLGSEQSKSSTSILISVIKNGELKGVLRKDRAPWILSKISEKLHAPVTLSRRVKLSIV
jgi:hypothetical protein